MAEYMKKRNGEVGRVEPSWRRGKVNIRIGQEIGAYEHHNRADLQPATEAEYEDFNSRDPIKLR